jgi:hypothetical protein
MKKTALPPGLTLTDEQDEAINNIMDMLNDGVNVVALAGKAGSGKTVCASVLTERFADMGQKVVITAMTNKAANVLRNKGIEQALTMHQATMNPIFKPPYDRLESYLSLASEEDEEEVDFNAQDSLLRDLLVEFPLAKLQLAVTAYKQHGIYAAFRTLEITDIMSFVIGWKPKKKGSGGIILIDEASMFSEEHYDVLLEVYNKVVLVGDQNQLPPVKGEPIFFNVPNRVTLETVHRQTLDSQPYRLASMILDGQIPDMSGAIPIDLDLCREGIPVLVWRNATRERLVRQIRAKLGFGAGPPQPGEILICRNIADKKEKEQHGFYNNSVWKVVRNLGGFICDLESEDGTIQYARKVFLEEFNTGHDGYGGLPFRFMLACTVHQAQGSEWPAVMIHKDDALAFLNFKFNEAKPWIYTGVTRAKELVIWVTDKVSD